MSNPSASEQQSVIASEAQQSKTNTTLNQEGSLDQSMKSTSAETANSTGSDLSSKKMPEMPEYNHRTITRTRCFTINGKEFTTTTTHLVYSDPAQRKISVEEQVKRKAFLRQFRLLAKQEARQIRELNDRTKQHFDLLESRINMEQSILCKNYEQKFSQIIKQYKQQLDRLGKERDAEVKQTRADVIKQHKENKSHNKLTKYDSKERGSQMSLHSLSFGTTSTANKKINKAKELDFLINEALFEVYSKHDRLLHEAKVADANERDNITNLFEQDKIKLKQRHLHMRHQLEKSKLVDFFLIKRAQLVSRCELELNELKQTINTERSRLSSAQIIERKQFVKFVKSQYKRNRLLMNKQENENVLGPIKELDNLHQKQTQFLEESIKSRLCDLEQSQIEKRNIMMENEIILAQEADEQFEKLITPFTVILSPTNPPLSHSRSFRKNMTNSYDGKNPPKSGLSLDSTMIC